MRAANVRDLPPDVVWFRHIVSSSIHLCNHYVFLTCQLHIHNSNILRNLLQLNVLSTQYMSNVYNIRQTYFNVAYNMWSRPPPQKNGFPCQPTSCVKALKATQSIDLGHENHTASVLWCCWLGGRKGIRPVKTEWWVLVWLSVWSEVQTCIWPSWCYCHSLSLASVKSILVLPFWYWLTQVVSDKGSWNGCVCVYTCFLHPLPQTYEGTSIFTCQLSETSIHFILTESKVLHLTQHNRRSFQPISWLGTEENKPSITKSYSIKCGKVVQAKKER